jgi:hypothetical protein
VLTLSPAATTTGEPPSADQPEAVRAALLAEAMATALAGRGAAAATAEADGIEPVTVGAASGAEAIRLTGGTVDRTVSTAESAVRFTLPVAVRSTEDGEAPLKGFPNGFSEKRATSVLHAPKPPAIRPIAATRPRAEERRKWNFKRISPHRRLRNTTYRHD